MIILENKILKAEISLHGAELRSIYRKDKQQSYLWYADAKFWGRSSPVLFPFVGSVRDKKYRFGGIEYAMGQHGFARDRDFALVSQTETEAWFVLKADEQTLAVYPFLFELEIGYRLEQETVRVMWRVKNADSKTMYFSIGAHPAFMCPPTEGDDQTKCSVVFYNKRGEALKSVVSREVGKKGLVTKKESLYELTEGRLPISEHLFDNDALVLENGQVFQTALADKDGHEYIRLVFDTPLVGIWSPAGKHAPFVCIEPWYGRCDAETFEGELSEREWGNAIEPGKTFDAFYEIMTD